MPRELEQEWRTSSFCCNGQWPFDDVEWYIDERRMDHQRFDTKKTFLIIYKRPISIVLQHTRTLHNHALAMHASVPIKTSRQQSLQWTCDHIDKPDQLLDTLRVIASSHANKLKMTCSVKQVGMSTFMARIEIAFTLGICLEQLFLQHSLSVQY